MDHIESMVFNSSELIQNIAPSIETKYDLGVQTLKFKKLDDKAVIPFYAHPGDIGMDVIATSVEYDLERDTYIYHTGLACEMKPGFAMFCLPQSRNTKTEGYIPNSPGLVDPATYRGEIQFRYKNRDKLKLNWIDKLLWQYSKFIRLKIEAYALSKAPYSVGDKVGQFVIIKSPQVEIVEVDELSETTRGTGGFGSTN